MDVHHIDLTPLLLCDVCDGEIMIPDELAASSGCCRACGVAYDFILDAAELAEAVGR